MKKRIKNQIIVCLSIIILLVMTGYAIWRYSQQYVKTEDAFVNADAAQISSQVNGRILHLYVNENEFVQKGQALFDIDPTTFHLAIEAAETAIKKNQLLLYNPKTPAPELKKAELSLQAATISLSQAKLDLHNAHMMAPFSGLITNLEVQEGQSVRAEQPLFTLVSHAYYWVDANFKREELARIHPGQRVIIQMGIYSDSRLEGVVESIRGSKESIFSFSPPEKASEHWTKVKQRVPVRVRILNPPKDKPLRVGTAATVTVYVNSDLRIFAFFHR